MSDHPLDSAHSTLVDPEDLPALKFKLSPGEVHLWQASLDSFSAENLERVLSEDEIGRAQRFHFARDRSHFTVARALLRKLLAIYLGTDSQLRFSYGDMGKPFLSDGESSQISFNLAHSGGRALYAFTQGRKLGVDLEAIREDTAGDDIAERFFSASEIQALQAVALERRNEAFFTCWTRKEAYIKARGEGLSMPLDSFDVSLAPEESAALLRNHTDEAEVARWEMRSIPVATGFVGALVVEGHGWKLRTFQIEPSAM